MAQTTSSASVLISSHVWGDAVGTATMIWAGCCCRSALMAASIVAQLQDRHPRGLRYGPPRLFVGGRPDIRARAVPIPAAPKRRPRQLRNPECAAPALFHR